jgi:hypothetical protein
MGTGNRGGHQFPIDTGNDTVALWAVGITYSTAW